MDWREKKARIEQIRASIEYLTLQLKRIQRVLREAEEDERTLVTLWLAQRQIVQTLQEEHQALRALKK